jgi:hypothetical protein
MHYPEYQADLERTLESEVLGEILFSTAARIARSRERREKWLRLRDLEAQTLRRVVAFLESQDQQAHVPALARARGLVFGVVLGLLPWSTAMKLLQDGTRPFLEVFERLERHADATTREFFAYVVAHERAIAQFARLERSGDPETSLRAVLDLLPRSPGTSGG